MRIEQQPAGGAARDKRVRDAWLRALERTASIDSQAYRTLPVVIGEIAGKHAESIALSSPDYSLTYRELALTADRFSQWALRRGIKVGDRVCLLMENCPDYVAIWLGITRVGGVVALLNTNLRGASLAHCIDAAQSTTIIVSGSLCEPLRDAAASTGASWQIVVHDRDRGKLADSGQPGHGGGAAPLPIPAVSIRDTALLIYTSGTTGLPKAARVSHRRILQWSLWFAGMMDLRPADNIYNCLPLYHSIGGVVGVCAGLCAGAGVAVREKFSASRFWSDIVEEQSTVFMYIGELCRYLVNSPPSDSERVHNLRMCCGNGLASDIWTRFQERFAIPQILEFYAATELPFSFFNVEGVPGSIGRLPAILKHRFKLALVRFNLETAGVARDERGFCLRCRTGEPGEAIYEIAAGADTGNAVFEGYTDRRATEDKVLRDVFVAGDRWVRSGDILRQDENGFYYFVDRVGDTFRWKGENTSTTEVSRALTALDGVREATVYGVAVPGVEGRAGMAALVVDSGFDLDRVEAHLATRLPEYARPLFIRICPELTTTSTFRPTKSELMKDGFDPAVQDGPFYFRDAATRCYVPLAAGLHADIQAGRVRF